MIRILGVFDYAASTGFATVGKNIVKEIAGHFKENVRIDIISNNYFGEPFYDAPNIYVCSAKLNDPKGDDFGTHFFLSVLKNSNEYDILFLINDLGAITPIVPILESIKLEKKENNLKSFKSIYYFPVDCKGFYEIFKGLEFFDTLVTFTEYARNEVLAIRPELKSKLKVIYHGTNTKDFYPLPADKVAEFRNEFFGENANKFIITNINRNQPRKDIPSTIFAFIEAKKRWVEGLPEPFLYLHMNAGDKKGWDLRAIFWQLDLQEGVDYMLLPYEWEIAMPEVDKLNLVYNASDVFLNTTLGEGHGLTQTEAMSTKLITICPNVTSLTEITGSGKRAYVYEADYPIVNTSDNIVRRQGNIEDIADLILEVATDKYLPSGNKVRLNKKVDDAYDWVCKLTWKELCKRWIEYIKQLA